MFAFLAVVAVLAAFLIVPGAVLALCARFRPLPTLALGAPITAGILALLAQVFAWIHVPWSLTTVVAVLIFLVLFASFKTWQGVRRHHRAAHALVEAETPDPVTPDAPDELDMSAKERLNLALPLPVFALASVLAFIFAGIVQLLPFVQTLPSLALPAQSFDAMFHFSSIRVIADNASAPWIGSLDELYPGRHGVYYPNQWAAILALFLPELSPTYVSNAMLMALTLSVWPLGVALLADYAFGKRSPAVPLSVTLSPIPLVFPYYQGILQALYPYVLSVMWWPAALWIILRASDVLAERRAWRLRNPETRQIRWYEQYLMKSVLGALVLLATVYAHPSTFGFIAIAVFVAFVNSIIRRELKPWCWVVAVAVALVGGVLVPLALREIGIGRRVDLAGDNLEVWRSVASMLGLAQIYRDPWWILLAFGAVGLVGLWWHAATRRDLRFAGITAAVSILIVATKMPLGLLSVLTGLWYGAYDRLGAAIATFAPVFAAGAVVHLSVVITQWVDSRGIRLGAATAVGTLLVVSIAGPYAPVMVADRQQLSQIAYVPGAQFHPPWVSVAEFQALVSLDLPKNAKLLGDPSTGAGLAYAVNGTELYIKQLNSTGFSKDQKYLAEHFNKIGADPRVCQIVRSAKITHFYDDATGVGAGEKFSYPGLHGVDFNRGFTEVATLDQAKIYRIDLCS